MFTGCFLFVFNILDTEKQDNILFTSLLLKDIFKNIAIDLSAHPLKTNVNNI